MDAKRNTAFHIGVAIAPVDAGYWRTAEPVARSDIDTRSS
jgi:hypothetical protein